MNIDIISLVKDALAHSGCENKFPQDLDPHAGIHLNFASTPAISIENVEDSVVLHCCLAEYAAALCSCPVSAVLETVAERAPWAKNHTVSLLDEGGELYLTAVVAEPHLRDGETFAAAIDGFYERIARLREVIQA